ncbi:MAG: hypothetical protein Q4F41_17530 [Eubacteriales bacterium]|nr:hypothetical protein [Eubacteriales bacterium]
MFYDDSDYGYPSERPNGFATASLVLGVIGILGSFSLSLALPFAVLGILFAILSRGKDRPMHGRARMGMSISIAALILNIALTAYAFYIYRPYIRSGLLQQYLESYLEDYSSGSDGGSDSYQYGGTLEDFLEEFGGGSGIYGGDGGYYTPYEGGDSYYNSQPDDIL